ncbi:uncharacterized protein LOC112599437 [Melanaphis sacchari]|uniref:uncharacterized protein LOC112599437 n=1 Tax=Melanaphis sacchari TaxID=742174 RepID=UPI000DC13BE1|nr:uncharacterized protein LOC112599437 [Melanaphis sacchari]
MSHTKNVHNHLPSPKKVNRQIVNNACKRKAIDDLFSRPKKVILKELGQSSADCSNFDDTDIHKIRKNIYAARQSLLPNLPKNVEEVHLTINNMDIKTTSEEQFLLVNDDSKNVLIFSCYQNLKFLCESENIYCDGTFTYSAKHFNQMFTIHGFKNGHYIPVVFCLLVNKSTDTYINTFNHIILKCIELKLTINPKSITIDFEQAIHDAVSIVWPDTLIVGCRFHLTQSWFRKIQNLGLVQYYKEKNSEIGSWIRNTFGLTFLSPQEVSKCFIEDFMSIIPNDQRVSQYADYLTDTYISENSIFPPVIWAESSSSLSRTTNACESFHSHFKENFYKEKPNIFMWLNIIKQTQTNIYCKMRSIHVPKKSKDYRANKRRGAIDDAIIKLQNGEMSRYSFVAEMSYNYKKM